MNTDSVVYDLTDVRLFTDRVMEMTLSDLSAAAGFVRNGNTANPVRELVSYIFYDEPVTEAWEILTIGELMGLIYECRQDGSKPYDREDEKTFYASVEILSQILDIAAKYSSLFSIFGSISVKSFYRYLSFEGKPSRDSITIRDVLRDGLEPTEKRFHCWMDSSEYIRNCRRGLDRIFDSVFLPIARSGIRRYEVCFDTTRTMARMNNYIKSKEREDSEYE